MKVVLKVTEVLTSIEAHPSLPPADLIAKT